MSFLGGRSNKDTRLTKLVKPGHDRPTARIPDNYSEQRLHDLREEAALHGRTRGDGVRPEGAPFPKASPATGYYGIPMAKQPQWTWEVPLYLFVGGAAGAAAVIAEAARMTGSDNSSKLIRNARTIAVAGGLLTPVLLVADLGRPARFLYMLRVFKKQSAMSVGVYIVSVFSTTAFLAKFHEVALHRFDFWPLQFMHEFTSSLSGIFGLGMASYTGVLVGATAIPVWNQHIKSLPVHFAMSGTSAAVGLLELAGNNNQALNTIGIGTAIMETAEGINTERVTEDDIARPLKEGASGAIVRIGGLLAGPLPLALRIASLFTGKERSLKLRRMAAASCVAGSLLTRVGWIRAGRVSASDWRLPLQLAPSQRDLPDKSEPPYAHRSELGLSVASD